MQKCGNRFLAVNLSHIVQITSSTDNNIRVVCAGLLALHILLLVFYFKVEENVELL